MSATHLCLGAEPCSECTDQTVELLIALPKRMADVSLCCKVADAVVMAKGISLLGTPTIVDGESTDDSRTVLARAVVTDPRLDPDRVLNAVTSRLNGYLSATAAWVIS